MTAPTRGLGTTIFAVVVAALVAAAMTFAANFVGAASACSGHTSYCAASTDKNGIYKGALFGADGKPYRNAGFEFFSILGSTVQVIWM